MSAMENIMFATDEGEEDELYTGYDFNSIATVRVTKRILSVPNYDVLWT